MRLPDPSLPPPALDHAPGGWLGLVLEAVDPGRLDDHDLVTAIVACERQVAHLHALQAAMIAELSRRPAYALCSPSADEDASESATPHHHSRVVASAQEVGPALALSPRQAEARVAAAVELSEDFPDTVAALKAGRIDWRRAALIAERTRALEPAARRQVEAAVLVACSGQTSAQLGKRLDRLAIAADPAAAARRHQAARADRRVEAPRPCGPDGIAELSLVGPAEDVVALYTAIDAAARARRSDGDERTLDQLRFDTLAALGWNALERGHLGCCSTDCSAPPVRLSRRHRRAATVNVTVAYTTLVGIDDLPAHLEGYGPVPAQVGRRIAADATLRRLLTDPADGRVLEYGRTVYAPPQALAEAVAVRDVTCRFPTCEAPAATCDLDHRRPWSQGGTTGEANVHALSRRCHVGKTLHGWAVSVADDGTTVWTSPAGHTHRVPPEAVGSLPVRPPRRRRRPGSREITRNGSPPDAEGEQPPF